MRAFIFIVIGYFISGYFCGEISTEGVCTVNKRVNGIYKTVDECCDGYMKLLNTKSTKIVCVPKCEDDCVYGECVAPNVCACNDGYEKKNGSSYVCHEKCKNGYVRNSKTNQCVPCDRKMMYCVEIDGKWHYLQEEERVNGFLIHKNTSSLCTDTTNETFSQTCSCLNGFNTSNKTCVCANGYKMREDFVDLCEPVCENECVNGLCIEPNECQCNDGYELGHNKNETNICYPICHSDIDGTYGCGNGTCIAPNLCKCADGVENNVVGNYACDAGALTIERQTAGMNWVIPGIILSLVVLATFLGGGFFIRKRKMNSSEAPVRKNDAVSDRFNIEVYSLEDF